MQVTRKYNIIYMQISRVIGGVAVKALQWEERIRASRCAVIGLGVSNLPLVDFLLERGGRVCVRDKKSREELGELVERLEARGVEVRTGESYLSDLHEELIFRSPGLRPDVPELSAAVARGASLTSEMELFLDLTPATVLGVTGSDGKTTTTTLTGLMLEAECRRSGVGKVFVGGNIGEPLLPRLAQMTERDFAVAELSSFQLQTMRRSAHRAALTNLSPNHLNWHTDMDEYARAKTNIYLHEPNESLVANAENETSTALALTYPRRVTWFSSVRESRADFEDLLKEGDRAVYVRDGQILLHDGQSERRLLAVSAIELPGKHNLENYMTALALTDGLVSPASAEEVATSFLGVPHRLECVRVLDGVTYYNSSIDSTPSRTAAALSALSDSPIVICGGYDKNVSFAPLAQVLGERAKAVVLTGATASKIREALDVEERVKRGELPIFEEADFARAVEMARQIASKGDTVLLSPACASFDAFRNFEERGETFRRIVNAF